MMKGHKNMKLNQDVWMISGMNTVACNFFINREFCYKRLCNQYSSNLRKQLLTTAGSRDMAPVFS